MNAKLTVPPLQKGPKKVNKLLIVLLAILLLAAVGLGLYVVTQQQISTRSRADVEPTQVPGLSCPANGASCAWDPVEAQDPPTYEYTVRDLTTEAVVVSGTTTNTTVSFTPEPNHRYDCSVVAVNQCGKSEPGVGENTCVSEGIPTPTVQPVCGDECQSDDDCQNGYSCSEQKCALTKCVDGSGTTCTEDKCAVVTPSPTPTPGPSATPTPGPSATPTPGPSATPTPGPSATPTPTGVIVAQSATATPTTSAEPTIPQAGGSSSIYFMVISTILVVTLFLVF